MSKSDTNQALAAFVRSRRESLGVTKVELARRSGLHASYWRYLEAGRFAHPSPKQLKKMATALDVPVEDLYGMVGYELPERLPSFRPYLRAKYSLPNEAVAELEHYFEMLRSYWGIPDDQPVFPPKLDQSRPGEDERADDPDNRRAA